MYVHRSSLRSSLSSFMGTPVRRGMFASPLRMPHQFLAMVPSHAAVLCQRCHSSQEAAAPINSPMASSSVAAGDAPPASNASKSVAAYINSYEPKKLRKFKFKSRIWYNGFSRNKSIDDYVIHAHGQMVSLTTTYRSIEHPDITITLLPLSHVAHPQFYYQVDLLLCQHDSVLMEGRTPFLQAPFSTLVPPRSLHGGIRPPELDGTPGGWEPKDLSAYWQPFSWGVKESPNYTVIHAADKYDYEKLPWFASLRFNLPLIGSFAREKHCLTMIPPLVDNGYRSFAIPWGAAHMPIFHEMLVSNGFEETSATSLPIFDSVDGEISQSHVQTWARKHKNRVIRTDFFYGFLGLGVGIGLLYAGVQFEVSNKKLLTNLAAKTGQENERTLSNMQR